MKLFSLALRNLNRQRRRTLLLGGAIAFGVLVVGILNTLAADLTANVEANLLDASGGSAFFSGWEMAASGRVLPVLRDPKNVEAALEAAGMKPRSTEVRSSARVGLLFGAGKAEATLVGLSPGALGQLFQRLQVLEGSLENLGQTSVVLPPQTAAQLSVEVGDTVLIRAQTISGQENLLDFTVAAIVLDPAAFGNPGVYAGLEAVNALLSIPTGGGQTLSVTWADASAPGSQSLYQKLKDLLPLARPVTPSNDAWAGLAGSLRGGQGNGNEQPWSGVQIRIRTLDEVMAPLLGLVDTLRAVNLGVLILMMIVILVGISNTFRMILVERTREVGTLRALGMHRREVLALFLAEALFLALGGIGTGGLVSLTVCLLLGAVVWPDFAGTIGGIFFRGGRLGMAIPWGETGLMLLTVAGICLTAAWAPARAAARLEPAEALRTQN